jgi:hypothetical protein
MINSIESIAKKFNSRSKVLELDFIDMFIALVSADSPSQLASRPVRYLFRDEIDKYKNGLVLKQIRWRYQTSEQKRSLTTRKK